MFRSGHGRGRNLLRNGEKGKSIGAGYQKPKYFRLFPVTTILGPRQCGKTTLARTLAADSYFDLENPQDIARLEQPQLALEDLTGLVVIDEIQRLPDLFPLLRCLVDQGKNRKFIILVSASRDLILLSSESLAGRIAYFQLGGHA